VEGIALAGASPTIQNTTIIDNAYCAITADMYSFPNLTGNTLENNAANGLCLLNINGDLDVDATWDITDTSYYLRDDVIQAAGKTLTIASGVVVKFGSGLSLIVNGTLTVQGIESAPVYLLPTGMTRSAETRMETGSAVERVVTGVGLSSPVTAAPLRWLTMPLSALGGAMTTTTPTTVEG
jgi:hypothetical protein